MDISRNQLLRLTELLESDDLADIKAIVNVSFYPKTRQQAERVARVFHGHPAIERYYEWESGNTLFVSARVALNVILNMTVKPEVAAVERVTGQRKVMIPDPNAPLVETTEDITTIDYPRLIPKDSGNATL